MKKQTRVILTVSIISILVIALIVLGINFFTQGTTVGCTGGTITSMGQAQFLSNDPTIGGQAWLLNLVETGGCQYATGTIDNSQITASGKTAVNDLTVTIQSSPQQCKYNLIKRSEYIYNLQANYMGKIFALLGNDANNKCSALCQAGDDYSLLGNYVLGNAECYCYHRTATATVGDIAFDKLQFSTDIIATIAGTQYKGTVSNSATQSVTLGSGAVNAQWTGNLVSGSDCPRGTEQNLISAYQSGWKFIDAQRYQDYKTYDSTGFESCVINYINGVTTDTPTTCTSKYNSYANSALSSKSFTAVGGESAVQSGTLSSGQASITLGKAVQFPQFTMRIKASTLGIYVPVSIPKIVSATSDCFTTGSNGNIVVKVQNQGTVAGSVVTSVSCTSGFSQQGTSITTQIGAGQTATINLPITGQTNTAQTSGICTITTQDRENPSNSDTKTVGTCVKGIMICTIGETRCNGVNKEVCPAGTGWQLQNANDASCQICVTNPTDPSCIVVPPKPVTNTSLWIFIIASSLSALVAFFLINPNIKIENKAGKYIVVILLAVIIGIIFGTIISVLAGLAMNAYNWVKGLIP